jgi:surface protein
MEIKIITTEKGEYTITINGTCSGFAFLNTGDRQKILSVVRWGNVNLGNYNGIFNGCTNLDLLAVQDVPNLSLTTVTSMFVNCTSLTTINNVNSWDISGQNSVISMFRGATSFNQILNSWDVSNVSVFSNMFGSDTSFNGDISNWDVSSAINMISMFSSDSSFNQNIGNWDVSNVTNMEGMFTSLNETPVFNQNIGNWNVGNVTTMVAIMQSKTSANYSTDNLNDIYNGWSLLTLQPNVTANFSSIKYTSEGQAGKDILTGVPNN